MLCSACAEHFAFARPDIVESCKKTKENAIDYATKHGFDKSYLTIMRRDLARYEQQLDVQTQHTFPRPWATERSFGDLFPVCDSVPVWQQSQHQRSWKHLQLSASQAECQLCMTLVAMIQYGTKGVEMESTQQITSDWLLEQGSCRPFWLRFLIQKDDAPTILLHFHVSVDSDSTDNILRPTRMPSGLSTEDQTCTEFLSQTLSNCLSNHASCAHSQLDAWVPKRLLDVRLNPPYPDSIVLVESNDFQKSVGEHEVRYFTLSHVWGSCRPAMLTQANYADMKKGLRFDELPRCFRDAIKTTRSLGARYLWIDALCIIQDSSKDWAEQAACMDKIYRGGVCNLAACDISDSHDSLFSLRQPQAGGSIVHRQTYTDSSVVFTVLPDWPRLTWEVSNLYRRAWVMQERWLSSRIIHFSQFPIWECKTALVTEGFPPNNSIRSSDNFPHFPETQRGWMFNRENKIGIIERWWKLVDRYSKCSLTYKSDKLVAISGMARVFSTLVNEPYYGGIWGGKHLILSLLWTRMSVNTSSVTLTPSPYRAPSWSWASQDGHIHTYEYRSILHILAEFVSTDVVPKSEDVFGQLIGGELVLRGFLFEISNPNERRNSLEGWLDYRGRANLSISLYFLPLAELKLLTQPQPRTFAGLFVQITENVPGKWKFQRIGCRQFNRGFGPQFLDADQWDRLENLHSPGEQGELIILI
ncbi:heterokaryon incompatibility protein-domain-containing protein [Fusarium oxysporum Fo47]|uniref:heterokaryon incompatibility protein-domain-containing protein n=1 Tax=Fusarium oxysporum Fo47 TaxID=660027 RepID=UPI002869DBB1|nr:heterokaryon incompatibility protein-domain-containing protein [Fusarium oxysporum Fo47]WJG35087.1 heterokaryon incompatibility protein-domain-containing protein [Fusarium oxysporum Fo47]